MKPAAKRRRRFVVGAGSALVASAAALAWRGTSSADAFEPSAETHRFEVGFDPLEPGIEVNRRLLGSNVGWAYAGDNMLVEAGRPDPAMLALAQQLGPTVLRYPGGTYTDDFHWTAPRNRHVFNKIEQPTTMDTQRLLELCEATGAEPIISVNLVTGTPQEAAAWLAAINVRGFVSGTSGRRLPRATFCELGNEPYLKEAVRPDLDLAPEEFARRANLFIRALRAVDPALRIGLPLTTDTRNGFPATPYPGFTRRVLALITERFDFVSVHNAYIPFGNDRPRDRAGLYWGAMAGARAVQADMRAMRELLGALRPGSTWPLALTEYSPLFSLGKGETDTWTTTPAGALFVADLLCTLARTQGLLMANHWSLSANGRFGAIHAARYPRPVFEALRLMGQALQGVSLATRVHAETVSTAAIGAVPAVAALPLIEALATRSTAADGRRTLRIVVINKDPRRSARGLLDFGAGLPVERARLELLSCNDVLDASDAPELLKRSERTLAPTPAPAPQLAFELPAHSLAMLTLDLKAA